MQLRAPYVHTDFLHSTPFPRLYARNSILLANSHLSGKPCGALHSVDLRGLSSLHLGIPSKTYNVLQVSRVGYSYPVPCIFATLSITLSLVTTPTSDVFPSLTQKKLRNPCYQIGYCTSCISTGATLVCFCLQQHVLPSQSMG